MHGKMIRPSTSIGNNGLPGEKSGWKRARKCGRVVHNYIDGKEGEIIGETGVNFVNFLNFSPYISRYSWREWQSSVPFYFPPDIQIY